MKAVVAAFNQEKALVGAFSVIVQPVVEPMDRFAALVIISSEQQPGRGQGRVSVGGITFIIYFYCQMIKLNRLI